MRNKVKGIGLATRLSFVIAGLTVLCITGMVIAIGLRVASVARADAVSIATATARATGGSVQALLENALDEARSLGKVFEAASVMPNVGITRRQANDILQYFVEHSPDYVGAYVAFEPDAYDGKDQNFVDEYGHDATGRFIPYWTRDAEGTGVLQALVGYDTKGPGDYYQVPRATGREAVIDPDFSTAQGSAVPRASLVVPIHDAQKAFIGIAGVDVTLDRIQQLVAGATLYRTGFLTLVDAGGKVAASKRTGDVGRTLTEIGMDARSQAGYASGKTFAMETRAGTGPSMFEIGAPFTIGNTQTSWTMIAYIPASEVVAPVTSLLLLIILVGVAALLVVSGGVVLMARTITRPLVLGVGFAESIAAGDLTAAMSAAERRDEIGALARALNTMSSTLRTMTLQIQDGSQQLASGTEELAASAQQLADGAQSQASTLEETAAAVEELSTSVEQVAGHAQSQSTTMQGTSRKMTVMLSAAREVSVTLEKVATSAGGSVERAREGAGSVRKAIGAIKDISESSEKIAGIVNVISEIADQTNLLALNASIEAARAGEHGRGFAVVADEVSKLAERSANSTKEIGVLIRETLRQVKLGVDLAEGSGSSMEQIIVGAQDSSALVADLQRSITAQVGAIEEAATSLEALSEVSQGISAATGEQTANSRQVSKAVEDVNGITQQAAASAEQVATSVAQLARLAQQLQGAVGQFRLEGAAAAVLPSVPA